MNFFYVHRYIYHHISTTRGCTCEDFFFTFYFFCFFITIMTAPPADARARGGTDSLGRPMAMGSRSCTRRCQ